ncbi:GNAT family N-acetyltransferase [Actomonas aquatica]|uniref:GNAT family N-acetyltransferase n=1 Tax=Actomonas aquatica TaxID=2866162 RepID=A0ABZ1C5U4_9BACT|nr:GNAT family N-acetyltransferase [Opitutus sp. WL0086]WRQ85665.1 GNAT family N-acetyltransferase [Opitutus sp. WL0086]
MSSSDESTVRVVLADLNDAGQAAEVLAMVDTYSQDAMGDGAPLRAEVRERLVEGLRAFPTTRVFLAYDGSQAVGVAVCFLGFSTFAAKPLLNLHDVCVAPSHRGRGVGRALLAGAEEQARAEGCCKLTLEVLDQNHRALRTYLAAGFKRYALQDGAGEAIFLTKGL